MMKIQPLYDKVLATDMHFGEQITKSGVVLLADNGKDRGIHPRWTRVYAVGPDHKEEYNVGDWILVEHGRWSRGIDIKDQSGENITIRLIDTECVIMWDTVAPTDAIVGTLSDGGSASTIRPEEFM